VDVVLPLQRDGQSLERLVDHRDPLAGHSRGPLQYAAGHRA
jgi:hypothetical protein